MKKIALLKYENKSYGADYEFDRESLTTIANYLTDFVEVSDEDLKLLKQYQNRDRFFIVEKIEDQTAFLKNKIPEYIELLKKEKLKEEKRKEQYKKLLQKNKKEHELK